MGGILLDRIGHDAPENFIEDGGNLGGFVNLEVRTGKMALYLDGLSIADQKPQKS